MRISIPMPRARHVRTNWEHMTVEKYFNPRTPRGARHSSTCWNCNVAVISILVPLTGCYSPICSSKTPHSYFNPHTPCGARQLLFYHLAVDVVISIPAPREGHDDGGLCPWLNNSQFQSPCPVRGTTSARRGPAAAPGSFNPRAPRGGRRGTRSGVVHGVQISTPVPAWGTTSC